MGSRVLGRVTLTREVAGHHHDKAARCSSEREPSKVMHLTMHAFSLDDMPGSWHFSKVHTPRANSPGKSAVPYEDIYREAMDIPKQNTP